MRIKPGATGHVLTAHGVPTGWSPVCVDDLTALVGGGTPSTDDPSNWVGGTIPWATPTDITALKSKWIEQTASRITQRGLESCAAKLLPPKAILYTSRATIGAKAVTAVAMATNQGFANFLLKPGVNTDFLYYYLDLLTPIFIRLGAGTTFLEISKREMRKVQCALPPEPEQQAIADILDTVDVAIERSHTAIEKARRVKKSLVQTSFTRGIGHAQFQPSALGQIPFEWKVVTVGDVLTEAQYGLSMPMHQKGQYPILRMAAIQDGNILLGDLKYVDLSERVAADYVLRRGDILFNRTNSGDLVGKVGVYRSDKPAVFASYLIRLKANSDLVDNYFLGQLLSSYPAQCRIRRYATPGVQQVNINATNLQRVQIAVPFGDEGLKEQRAIAEILEQQDECLRQLESRVGLLDRLKRGLMQALLTGKVRVPVGAMVDQNTMATLQSA
jgi:type I restriction enzyme S subunit